MNQLFRHLQGDRAIWALVGILAIFSFMPVYSASTNLVYVVGNGSTLGHLVKHAVLLCMGFAIILVRDSLTCVDKNCSKSAQR